MTRTFTPGLRPEEYELTLQSGAADETAEVLSVVENPANDAMVYVMYRVKCSDSVRAEQAKKVRDIRDKMSEKTVWINTYMTPAGFIAPSIIFYDTEAECLNHVITGNPSYLGAYPVTVKLKKKTEMDATIYSGDSVARVLESYSSDVEPEDAVVLREAARRIRAMDEHKDIVSAPHTAPILVYYDHDADPRQDPEHPGRLTAYAANAEGLSHLCGRGFAVALWQDGHHDEDECTGDLYYVPGCWVLADGVQETVVNAIYWWNLPGYPLPGK